MWNGLYAINASLLGSYPLLLRHCTGIDFVFPTMVALFLFFLIGEVGGRKENEKKATTNPLSWLVKNNKALCDGARERPVKFWDLIE